MTSFGKVIDNIFIEVSIFLLFEIWLSRYIKSLVVTTILAGLITLTLFVILKTVLSGKEIKRTPLSSYYATITILGNDNAVALYKKIYPNDTRYIKSLLRFSDLNLDDISLTFRESGNLDAVIICKNASRNVQLFASSLPKNFTFIRLKTFTKMLDKNNLLPEILEKKVEKKLFKELVYDAFSKNNAKYFFLTGVILCISALFTRYTIYYAVMASLSLILSIFTFIRAEK